VAILLVYISILSCCSALCIFEKYILAFVGGTKVTNSCLQGELCIKRRQIGRNAFVQGEHAFMHLGDLFRLNFSCALLPMVEDHVWFKDRWMVVSLCDE
jgi:hypothetical protein